MNFAEQKARLKSSIANFFDGVYFKKTKMSGSFGVWYVKMLFGADTKYLSVIVPQCDEPIDTLKSLDDLDWICFQTRTLADGPEMDAQSFERIHQPLMNTIIKKVNVDEVQTYYQCDSLPIEIKLLHTMKCNEDVCSLEPYDIDQYAQNGNIAAALNTFQCILTFNL